MNATVTMNLFGARVTPSIWIAVTIGMIAIGVMAAAVPEALTDRAARSRSAMPWSGWCGAGRGSTKRRMTGVPWWRPVLYSLVPAGLWVASVWVAPPWQYVLWGLAVAIEIVLLSFLGSQQSWLRQALDVDHLVERVGLLVVIVFGESILAIIAELDAHWTVPSGDHRGPRVRRGVDAGVDLLRLRDRPPSKRGLRRLQLRGSVNGLRDTVMYLPFLLIAGIALFASGLGTAVADAGHHLPAGAAVCLAGGISLFFIASTAESLRYGAPWSDIVLWGPRRRRAAVAAGAAVGRRRRGAGGGGIGRADRRPRRV